MQTERLGDLARMQAGVFARWQAYELGVPRFMVSRRLESKEWLRVLGSTVLRSATSHLGAESGSWAACLACGPRAVLSGPSAVLWHGLDVGPWNEEFHWVTVPPERHLRVPQVHTLREALPDDDLTLVRGMRVTTIPRSVIDALRVLPERTGRDLVDRALLRGWLTVELLDATLPTFAGRRGVGRLRVHATRVRTGAGSEAERLPGQRGET